MPGHWASCNVLSEDEAKRMNLKLTRTKVTLENASGTKMKVKGECVVYAAAPGGRNKRIRVIVSPDLRDKMLLGKRSQKLLGLLHSNCTGVIKEEISGVSKEETANCNQVTGGQKAPCKGKQKKGQKVKPEFPIDSKKYPRIQALFEEYRDVFRDVFRDELEESDRLSGGLLDLKLKPGA